MNVKISEKSEFAFNEMTLLIDEFVPLSLASQLDIKQAVE
jgi:hypothetical protein